jgi:exoribonuclease-2
VIETVGQVVYLAEQGALLAARVCEIAQGGRYRTEDTAAVSRWLVEARLFGVSSQAVAGSAELEQHWQAVQERAATWDLEAAWRALTAQGLHEAPRVALEAVLSRVHSTSPVDRDAWILAVFRDGTWFRIRQRLVEVRAPDAVAQTMAHRAEEARRRSRVAEVARALEACLSGQAASLMGLTSELEAVALGTATAPALETAGEIVAGIGRAPVTPERVAELLVEVGTWSPVENLALKRTNLPLGMPEELVLEARRLVSSGVPAGDRLDLTGLYAVSIDDAETTEVDDAVAIDGERVQVLIADAAAWVARGSPIDQEARVRASTLYLPERRVLMLPAPLAEDAASLRCQAVRPALAFSFEIGPEGALWAFDVRPALCRVAERLTYDSANQLLELPPNTPAGALLHRLHAWTGAHQKLRRRTGALSLSRREVHFEISSGGQVTVHRIDASSPARELVAELMVAVGMGVGRLCHEQQIPALYRTQARPDGPVPDPGRITDSAARVEALRRLKPVVVSVRPGPHFTLGAELYVQVTSPLRRYADLAMHQQLRAWRRTGYPCLTEGELTQVALAQEPRIGAVRRLEQESRRHWSLVWLASQGPHLAHPAIVTRRMGRVSEVELDELGLSAVVAGGLEVGRRIEVRAERVDVFKGELELRRVGA